MAELADQAEEVRAPNSADIPTATLVTAKAREPSLVVLRVYNYYRVLLSFFLLYLFIDVPDQMLVGALYPDLYQVLVLGYFVVNLVIAVTTLLLPRHWTGNSVVTAITRLTTKYPSTST